MITPPKQTDTRQPWGEYFMNLAQMVSERATCDRLKVGAILVKDKRILATGYNGSLPGDVHCDEWKCDSCGSFPWGYHRTLGNFLGKDGDKCPWCEKGKVRGGHLMEDGHCVRTVHAEINVISQAARFGIATEGATLYCNYSPCWPCFKTILSAGIIKVIYASDYKTHVRVASHPYTQRLGNRQW